MRRLILIKGSSGSGKSNIASAMLKSIPKDIPAAWFETDEYWITNNIQWKRNLVERAHKWNQDRTEIWMARHSMRDECTIIISNTFPKLCYEVPYLQMALKYGYEVQEIYTQRELRVCRKENAWNGMTTKQNRIQIHNTECIPLDTTMAMLRGDLTDQYCYECCEVPCICNWDKGDDEPAQAITPEPTVVNCPSCGSDQTETAPPYWHCSCGATYNEGIDCSACEKIMPGAGDMRCGMCEYRWYANPTKTDLMFSHLVDSLIVLNAVTARLDALGDNRGMTVGGISYYAAMRLIRQIRCLIKAVLNQELATDCYQEN